MHLKQTTHPFFLAVRSKHNDVAIVDELALLAVGKRERLRASPRDLQHGAERSSFSATDGARAQQVSARHVATVDGVVRELLRRAPVHVLHV